MSCILRNALIPTGTGYETTDVRIEGERIAAIDKGLPATGTDSLELEAGNQLLLPGFVNAHTHSSELWQRGIIPPYPLELWLAQLHEYAPPDPEKIYLSALATAVETLLSGGTTVVDHLILIPGQELATLEAAVRAYREVGIRAFIGPLLQDQALSTCLPGGSSFAGEAAAYPLSTSEVLALVEEAVEKYHRPEEGITLMVAPTGIQLCSDKLFEGCAELSQKYDLPRHAHLLETRAQQRLAQEKYGCSAVEHLERLGYLDRRTSLAHCVWLTDADIEILARTGSTVVHNPLSNLRLGSGIAPILKYRRAGVNVAFGCDGSASNDSQDLLEAIKIGTILHNITDPDYRHWISPRESVEMASRGGAIGLGLGEKLGSLEVGKQADLVLYDLTQLSLLPRTDPIGLLVLGRPTQVVHSVWVRGKRVVANGEVTTVDVAQLRQELFEHSHWDPFRRSQQAAQLEARYRQVMGLPE
ncbi:amidohydrolase [Synechococcus sp. OH20]|uniref:amidohydrolase n=1 Tax=Synechococcus sp. OH20 TaxID=139337 RepID=UPI0039C729BB